MVVRPYARWDKAGAVTLMISGQAATKEGQAGKVFMPSFFTASPSSFPGSTETNILSYATSRYKTTQPLPTIPSPPPPPPPWCKVRTITTTGASPPIAKRRAPLNSAVDNPTPWRTTPPASQVTAEGGRAFARQQNEASTALGSRGGGEKTENAYSCYPGYS